MYKQLGKLCTSFQSCPKIATTRSAISIPPIEAGEYDKVSQHLWIGSQSKTLHGSHMDAGSSTSPSEDHLKYTEADVMQDSVVVDGFSILSFQNETSVKESLLRHGEIYQCRTLLLDNFIKIQPSSPSLNPTCGQKGEQHASTVLAHSPDVTELEGSWISSSSPQQTPPPPTCRAHQKKRKSYPLTRRKPRRRAKKLCTDSAQPCRLVQTEPQGSEQATALEQAPYEKAVEAASQEHTVTLLREGYSIGTTNVDRYSTDRSDGNQTVLETDDQTALQTEDQTNSAGTTNIQGVEQTGNTPPPFWAFSKQVLAKRFKPEVVYSQTENQDYEHNPRIAAVTGVDSNNPKRRSFHQACADQPLCVPEKRSVAVYQNPIRFDQTQQPGQDSVFCSTVSSEVLCAASEYPLTNTKSPPPSNERLPPPIQPSLLVANIVPPDAESLPTDTTLLPAIPDNHEPPVVVSEFSVQLATAPPVVSTAHLRSLPLSTSAVPVLLAESPPSHSDTMLGAYGLSSSLASAFAAELLQNRPIKSPFRQDDALSPYLAAQLCHKNALQSAELGRRLLFESALTSERAILSERAYPETVKPNYLGEHLPSQRLSTEQRSSHFLPSSRLLNTKCSLKPGSSVFQSVKSSARAELKLKPSAVTPGRWCSAHARIAWDIHKRVKMANAQQHINSTGETSQSVEDSASQNRPNAEGASLPCSSPSLQPDQIQRREQDTVMENGKCEQPYQNECEDGPVASFSSSCIKTAHTTSYQTQISDHRKGERKTVRKSRSRSRSPLGFSSQSMKRNDSAGSRLEKLEREVETARSSHLDTILNQSVAMAGSFSADNSPLGLGVPPMWNGFNTYSNSLLEQAELTDRERERLLMQIGFNPAFALLAEKERIAKEIELRDRTAFHMELQRRHTEHERLLTSYSILMNSFHQQGQLLSQQQAQLQPINPTWLSSVQAVSQPMTTPKVQAVPSKQCSKLASDPDAAFR